MNPKYKKFCLLNIDFILINKYYFMLLSHNPDMVNEIKNYIKSISNYYANRFSFKSQ